MHFDEFVFVLSSIFLELCVYYDSFVYIMIG